MPYKFNPFSAQLDIVNPTINSPLLFKGEININSDFPTLADVENGWFYLISTNVTDNDASKTNTSQSFVQYDEIVWNGTNWTLLGNNNLDNTYLNLSGSNANTNINIGVYNFTTTGNGSFNNVTATSNLFADTISSVNSLTNLNITASASLNLASSSGGDINLNSVDDIYLNCDPVSGGTVWVDNDLNVGSDVTWNGGNSGQANTAYTHSQDNTQAHSDYLLNNADDITTYKLTLGNLKVETNLDADQHIELTPGDTADQRFYFQWNDYLGNAKWYVGRNAVNQFIIYDSTNGVHNLRFLPNSHAQLGSGGTGAVQINAYPDAANKTGTGGLEIWSGGSVTPTLWTRIKDGYIYTYQTADSVGNKIFGFDDKSASSLHTYISSNGNGNFTATGALNFYAGAEMIFATGANKDMWINLGDNIGTEKFNIRNYSWVTQAWINSVGKFSGKSMDIGDGTNYTEIKTDGEINLHGTARVKKSIWLSAGGLKAPGSHPATFIECGLTGVWSFANIGVEANQEQVSGTLKMPDEMDISIAPTFHIGWHTGVANNGNVRWKLEYLWIAPNDDTCAVAQESLEITSTSSSTADGFVFATFTGIDLPSSTDKAMLWRITRESVDGLDTVADTVEMRGAALVYTANKLGEAT